MNWKTYTSPALGGAAIGLSCYAVSQWTAMDVPGTTASTEDFIKNAVLPGFLAVVALAGKLFISLHTTVVNALNPTNNPAPSNNPSALPGTMNATQTLLFDALSNRIKARNKVGSTTLLNEILAEGDAPNA
jgi:hypothetical protein